MKEAGILRLGSIGELMVQCFQEAARPSDPESQRDLNESVKASSEYIWITNESVIPWIVEIEFLAIFDHGNQRHTS